MDTVKATLQAGEIVRKADTPEQARTLIDAYAGYRLLGTFPLTQPEDDGEQTET